MTNPVTTPISASWSIPDDELAKQWLDLTTSLLADPWSRRLSFFERAVTPAVGELGSSAPLLVSTYRKDGLLHVVEDESLLLPSGVLMQSFMDAGAAAAATELGVTGIVGPTSMSVPDELHHPVLSLGSGRTLQPWLSLDSYSGHLSHDGFRTDPVAVPALGGRRMVLTADTQWTGSGPRERQILDTTIEAFLNPQNQAFAAGAAKVFADYQETINLSDVLVPTISGPDQVWGSVAFRDRASIDLRRDGSGAIVTINGECTWAEEHGLSLEINDGHTIGFVGRIE